MRRFTVRFSLVLAALALLALVITTAALAAEPGSRNADTAVPDITDDLGSWAALIGIALPAVTALLQKVTWPSWVNALIFGAAVVVASIVYGLIRFGDNFTWAHWQGTLLAIVTWGIATYHTFWNPGNKPTTVANTIRANIGIR